MLQGLNAIDAAVHKGLTHVVYNGSENIKKITGKDCGHLDSKAAIEEYLREVGEFRLGRTTGGKLTNNSNDCRYLNDTAAKETYTSQSSC